MAAKVPCGGIITDMSAKTPARANGHPPADVLPSQDRTAAGRQGDSLSESPAIDRPAARPKRQPLAIALAITSVFLVVEVAGALLSNSLALLADAAHMLTDVAALGL